MIAEFHVSCPECASVLMFRADIGSGTQTERSTCPSCASDIVVTSDFPAPATAPFADRFQP